MKTVNNNLETIYHNLAKAFKGVKAVKVMQFNGSVTVYHYSAAILTVHQNNDVIIDNGGYETATTKKHINKALEVAGIPAYITQRAFNWYVNQGQSESTFSRFFPIAA
ncbi:MAG: hypothetical protein NVS3B25_19020 [Hymenobacter sp.]